MRDYLVNHALKNAWCSPSQDLQVIFRPQRISRLAGVRHYFMNMWVSLPLPTADVFHVYQIGQVHPSLLGMFPQRMVWVTLAELMGRENLIVDVYTNNGKMLPRFESWVLVTGDNNLILVVRNQTKIANLRTEPVYFRFYSNAYFSSDRADGQVQAIECAGTRIGPTTDALMFQRRVNDSRQRPGLTNVYVNGRYVHNFTPQLLTLDDTVEFVYDSTVKRVIDFPVASLPTFDSLRDLRRKYLLHYEGTQVGGANIDYRDDIDVYLIKTSTVNSLPAWEGVLFHKNQEDAFTMVTHRDYAVAVPYVDNYVNTLPGWTQIHDLTIRLIIRNSGWQRPLIDEHHRIKELYRLSEQDRRMAMTGVESSVDVWQAPALENSFYPKVMDAYSQQVTYVNVQRAYGYNAISRILADTPQPVVTDNGRRVVVLPPALRVTSTIYEYDVNGHLIDYYHHTSGREYSPQNAQTVMVEGIVGFGKYKINTRFQEATMHLTPGVNYRFYCTPIRDGVVQLDEWEDVTGNDEFYMVDESNNVTWSVSQDDYAYAVKSDQDFLAYDLVLSPVNGLLKFTVDGLASYPASPQGVCFITLGKVELWLNNRALVENLDYFVKDMQFVITNKKYLVPGNQQKITVRATGFCRNDMTREAPDEAGFVRYGLLSRNQRYDVRDDKVVRIVVDGRTFHRSALLFSEDDNGIRMENVPNGAPYYIDDVVVPLRDLADGEDTYSFRAKSLVVDQKVSDYLTLKNPEPPRVNPDMILDKYPIYSPFSSTVMHDLINGTLSMDEFRGQYSEHDMREALANYTYLLDYDPCMKSIDLAHVAIHPHNLNVETLLDIYQYNFLARAIKSFLLDRVDITRFIRIRD